MTWRTVFGFYDDVSLPFASVQQRYLELKEIRKGDSYAVAQLNDAWKEYQRKHEYRTAA